VIEIAKHAIEKISADDANLVCIAFITIAVGNSILVCEIPTETAKMIFFLRLPKIDIGNSTRTTKEFFGSLF